MWFATSEILMDETTIPQNFTLSRDFVKRTVEQFTAWKTMEVVHHAFGLVLNKGRMCNLWPSWDLP